jgi:hypothetical protein
VLPIEREREREREIPRRCSLGEGKEILSWIPETSSGFEKDPLLL